MDPREAPSSNNLDTTVRRSQRAPKSCNPCRKLKIKCSSQLVPCAQCIKRGTERECRLEIVRVKGRLVNSDITLSDAQDVKTLQLDNHALREKIAELEKQAHTMQNKLTGFESLLNIRSDAIPLPQAAIASRKEDDDANTIANLEMGERINFLLKGLDFLSLGWNPIPDPLGTTSSHSDKNREQPMENTHTASEALQSLLPSRRVMDGILDFSYEWTWWRSCSYHIPTFKRQVEQYWEDSENVRWSLAALLLAILSVGLFYMEEEDAVQLGITAESHRQLPETWSRATIECLTRANYLDEPSVISVQTIAILCDVLNGLGLSSLHNCLLGIGIRLAQGLNLHLLGTEPLCPHCPCLIHHTPHPHFELSADAVQREISRRCWTVLLVTETQSILAREKHGIPQAGDSILRNFEDVPEGQTAIVLPQEESTGVSHLISYRQQAFIFHDCLSRSNGLEDTLQADRKLEHLVASFSQLPDGPTCPTYLPWARHALLLTVQHRRMFLWKRLFACSFRDPSLAIARQLGLQCAEIVRRERSMDLPARFDKTWGVMMSTLTAAIFLAIDLYHTSEFDIQLHEKRDHIHQLLNALNRGPLGQDSFAKRASGLVTWLLSEEEDFRRIYEGGV